MKLRLSLILVCCLAIGCNKNIRPEKPDSLIAKDQMTNILYDLYVINGAKNVNRALLEKEGFEPEQYVFRKYNIDSLQFAKSNNYYAFDPEEYREIVEEVRLRLEVEKDKTQELQKAEQMNNKRRQDSIKKASNRTKKVIDSSKIRIKPVISEEN